MKNKPTIMLIRLGDIRPNTIRRHEKLAPEWEQRARLLYPRVKTVNQTVEQWIDGFCFDMNPDREIVIWEAICDATDLIWALELVEFQQMTKKHLQGLINSFSFGVVNLPATDEQVKIISDFYLTIRYKQIEGSLK